MKCLGGGERAEIAEQELIAVRRGLATRLTPMIPPAPATFSTITC